MKKGRVIFATVLALSLVVGIGILSASAIVQIAGCSCYGGCYYCAYDNESQSSHCQVFDEAGGCFCHNNPCYIRLLCCKAN